MSPRGVSDVVEVKSSSSEESLTFTEDVYESTPAARRLRGGRRKRQPTVDLTADESAAKKKRKPARRGKSSVEGERDKTSSTTGREDAAGEGGARLTATAIGGYNRFAANCIGSRGKGQRRRKQESSFGGHNEDKVLGRRYRDEEESPPKAERTPLGRVKQQRGPQRLELLSSEGSRRNGGGCQAAVSMVSPLLPVPPPPPRPEQWPHHFKLSPLKKELAGDFDGRSSVSTTAATVSSVGLRTRVNRRRGDDLSQPQPLKVNATIKGENDESNDGACGQPERSAGRSRQRQARNRGQVVQPESSAGQAGEGRREKASGPRGRSPSRSAAGAAFCEEPRTCSASGGAARERTSCRNTAEDIPRQRTRRRSDDGAAAKASGDKWAEPKDKRRKVRRRKERGASKPQETKDEIDSDWEWKGPQSSSSSGVVYLRNGEPIEVERLCPVRGCHETVPASELDSHILARHQGSSHAAEVRRRFENERAFKERRQKPAEERPKFAGVRCPTPLVGLLLAQGSTSWVPVNYRPHPEIEKALAEGGFQQHPQQGWTLARICASLIYSCRIERIGKMRERCLEELLSRTYQPIMEKLPRAYRNGDLEPIWEAMCVAYRRRTLTMDERATDLVRTMEAADYDSFPFGNR
ncbi:hypothetical protein FOZ61_002511 [Perkinsus olseni]|uniref:Uncharacterized protein n=1 Tax=Perkinsus olseni TaxID=32597 RepID=A0A7J6MG34_PEROL|nr:hypothetical protein FOZ61_002511 [Perkinsus olseni]